MECWILVLIIHIPGNIIQIHLSPLNKKDAMQAKWKVKVEFYNPS